MPRRIGVFKIPDDRELEKALNALGSAINTIAETRLSAGKGVRVTNDGGTWQVEATPEPVYETRGLIPRLVRQGDYLVVGLTPGWVVFLNSDDTSTQEVPYIGADFASGDLVDADPPPGIDKTTGTYYTRLELQEDGHVRVEFVPVADPPETDATYLIINKFKLQENDTVRHLQILEVYLEQPLVNGEITTGPEQDFHPSRPAPGIVKVSGGHVFWNEPDSHDVWDSFTHTLVGHLEDIDGVNFYNASFLEEEEDPPDGYVEISADDYIWLKLTRAMDTGAVITQPISGSDPEQEFCEDLFVYESASIEHGPTILTPTNADVIPIGRYTVTGTTLGVDLADALTVYRQGGPAECMALTWSYRSVS